MSAEFTPEEIENLRLAAAKDHGELSGDPGPGSLYCHEALDRAGNIIDTVDQHLCAHPSVFSNPEWYALAMRAEVALVELYQRIGAVHLSSEDPNA